MELIPRYLYECNYPGPSEGTLEEIAADVLKELEKQYPVCKSIDDILGIPGMLDYLNSMEFGSTYRLPKELRFIFDGTDMGWDWFLMVTGDVRKVDDGEGGTWYFNVGWSSSSYLSIYANHGDMGVDEILLDSGCCYSEFIRRFEDMGTMPLEYALVFDYLNCERCDEQELDGISVSLSKVTLMMDEEGVVKYYPISAVKFFSYVNCNESWASKRCRLGHELDQNYILMEDVFDGTFIDEYFFHESYDTLEELYQAHPDYFLPINEKGLGATKKNNIIAR